VFQFDIFSVPFDTKNGYQIYSSKLSDILVIRLEDLTTCCENAMHDFLGIQSFSLSNDNTGQKKWYAEIYRQTLKEFKIPKLYLDQIYNSRFSKHFYSCEELQRFKMKWMECPMSITLEDAQNEILNDNIDKAIRLLLSVLECSPHHPLALNLLGKIHWNVGDYKQAKKYFQMACHDKKSC